MYRVVATEHDTALGGIKFDELLSQHLASEFQRYFDCAFVNFSWKIITERICINNNYPLLLRSRCSNTQLWPSWFCCRQCKQDVRGNTRAMAKLMAGAEYCKHILSSRDTATCAIESLYDGIDMHSTVSRYCQWSTSQSLLLSYRHYNTKCCLLFLFSGLGLSLSASVYSNKAFLPLIGFLLHRMLPKTKWIR